MATNNKNKKWKNKKFDETAKSSKAMNSCNDMPLSYKGANDIAWYNHTPAATQQAGKLAFSDTLGVPITLRSGDDAYEHRIPGFMGIHFVSTPGVSRGKESVVSVAARSIYTTIRKANAGSANYESQDLMLYLMGVLNLYDFYSFMRRLYGAVHMYTVKNRYLPKVFFDAQEVDFEDLQRNLANFRLYAINFAQKAATLLAPANLPIFRRHAFMLEGAYVDDEDISKSQTYMFIPEGFHEYVEDEGAGFLRYKPWCLNPREVIPDGYHPKTFAEICAYGDELLNAMYLSEDCAIMSGDILKAYGPEGVFRLATLPEDYVMPYDYSEEILAQIENAVAVGSYEAGYPSMFDITQTSPTGAVDGGIYFDPQLIGPEKGELMTVINSRQKDPSPEDVMLSTRLHTRFYHRTGISGDPTEARYGILSCGTEVVLYFMVIGFTSYVANPDGEGYIPNGPVFAVTSTACLTRTSSAATTRESMISSWAMNAFDWHPIQSIWYVDSVDPLSYTLMGFNWEWANYAIASDNFITGLHDTALLSLFGIPEVPLI